MDLQDLVGSLFELTSEPPGRAADLKQFDTRDFDQIWRDFAWKIQYMWNPEAESSLS